MSIVRFPNEVADRITADTWTPGWGDYKTKTCLYGHVRQCDLRPGDEYLIAAVFNNGPGSMAWNDKQTSHIPVAKWARKAEITDGILAETFGPQWSNVIGLVRRLAVITEAENTMLKSAWSVAVARDTPWHVAWSIVRSVARDAARSAARDVARDAAWDAARGASGYPVRHEADAAMALVVADLVGQHGLEQHHLDTLLAPVRQVLGDPLDPDTVQEWVRIGERGVNQ